MSRLTEISYGGYTYSGELKSTREYDSWVDEAVNKLGKLEDLEEELGCPLEARCKITTDTTIYDDNGISFKISHIHDNYFTATICCGFGDKYELNFMYSDYKKIWFLKEDRTK